MPASGGALRTVEIVLADDHRMVREGLRLVLERESDLRVVGEAADVAETARILRACEPNVLLLDVLMGHESSLAALPALREASPSTAIVVLTVEADPVVARETIRRGATGYLGKNTEEEKLIEAVRSAAAGRGYLDPDIGARLGRVHSDAFEELAERDIEILGLLALGHTNSEIAARLYLSVRTVEGYSLELRTKLGLSTRAQVAAYVRAHRLSA